MVDTRSTKGEATRRRILDAATGEFAQHGIAGARVDRIAIAAQSNKAQMYSYFGNKEQLFDAVFDENIRWVVDAIPIDGTDLPGYAVRLYDAYLANPSLVRLSTWTRLERHPAGHLFADDLDRDASKINAIVAGQLVGKIDSKLNPRDVLSIVTAMSMTWSPASALIAASPDEDDDVHTRRKHALALTVQRAFTP